MSARVSREQRMAFDRMLSERHDRMWGKDCPAVDLDFLLNEYNRGVPVAIVEYKYHLARLDASSDANYRAIADLYRRSDDGFTQIPLFIVRYWVEPWAFMVSACNETACQWFTERLNRPATPRRWRLSDSWAPMSEQEYVRMLYRLRKDVLNEGDRRTIARLDSVPPPIEVEGVA